MWMYTEMVLMKDGVRLSTDVYLPHTAGRWPAILVRTPYGKRRLNAIPVLVARRGYAVVVQDVRGRGRSEGQFEFAETEGRDGRDTIEWIRGQNWCDGYLGIVGPSYGGWCAFAVAGLVHAVVALAAPVDWYNVVFPGGVLQLHWALPWAMSMSDGPSVGTNDLRPMFLDWSESKEQPPLLRTWLQHSLRDNYWHRRNLRATRTSLSTPVLFIGGLYDFLIHEVLRGWMIFRNPHNSLIIGPWSHHSLLNPSRGLLDVDFGNDSVLELVEVLDRWFRIYLKRDVGQGSETVRLFITGGYGWIESATWPCAGEDEHFWMKSDGTLCQEDSLEMVSELVYEPGDPPPTQGGRCWPLPQIHGLSPGPDLQDTLEGRRDVAVYLTAALTREVVCAGCAEVSLTVEVTSRTVVLADLVDRNPNGGMRLIADTEPRIVEPGKCHCVTLSFHVVGHRFRAGHAIGLQIRCGSFPRYAPFRERSCVTLFLGPKSRLTLRLYPVS